MKIRRRGEGTRHARHHRRRGSSARRRALLTPRERWSAALDLHRPDMDLVELAVADPLCFDNSAAAILLT